jgi:hypothetical protein
MCHLLRPLLRSGLPWLLCKSNEVRAELSCFLVHSIGLSAPLAKAGHGTWLTATPVGTSALLGSISLALILLEFYEYSQASLELVDCDKTP